MMHRAEAGGVLEADLDTLTTEKAILLQQRLGKKWGLRKPEPSARHISSSCTQGGGPGLGTTPKSAIPKHSHVLTVWEVRDWYQATNLHLCLGQVSSPFHASKSKLHFLVVTSGYEPVKRPSSASALVHRNHRMVWPGRDLRDHPTSPIH